MQPVAPSHPTRPVSHFSHSSPSARVQDSTQLPWTDRDSEPKFILASKPNPDLLVCCWSQSRHNNARVPTKAASLATLLLLLHPPYFILAKSKDPQFRRDWVPAHPFVQRKVHPPFAGPSRCNSLSTFIFLFVLCICPHAPTARLRGAPWSHVESRHNLQPVATRRHLHH